VGIVKHNVYIFFLNGYGLLVHFVYCSPVALLAEQLGAPNCEVNGQGLSPACAILFFLFVTFHFELNYSLFSLLMGRLWLEGFRFFVGRLGSVLGLVLHFRVSFYIWCIA